MVTWAANGLYYIDNTWSTTSANTITWTNCTTSTVNWTYIPTVNWTTSTFIIENNYVTDDWRSDRSRIVMPTDEERAAQLQVERAAREEYAAEYAAEYEAARVRAEKLLLENLDEIESERWRTKGKIHVRSQHGRRYCIHGDRVAHNIFELDENDRRIKELCVHINDCPLADNVLAQKLALEYAEDHLLAKANIWTVAH